MSEPYGAQSIPASWYPDPADARQLRYWDGNAWTAQTAPNPAAAPPTPPPAPPAAPPSPPVQQQQQQPYQAAPAQPTAVQPTAAQPNYEPAPSQPPFQPAEPSFAQLFEQPISTVYTPLSFSEGRDDGPIESVWSPNTVMGWLYAIAPLLLVVLVVMPVPLDLLNARDLPVRAGIVLLFVVLAIVLPAIDRLQLRHREFLRSPPALLGVLPPIFSIVRAASVGRRGLAVAGLSLLVQGAVAVALWLHFAPPIAAEPQPVASADELSSVGMVAPFTEEQVAALLTPEGMAAKIRFDAQGSALNYKSVECEPAASTALGAEVMCTAIGTLADYDIHVQLLPTTDGVPFTVMSVVPSLKI